LNNIQQYIIGVISVFFRAQYNAIEKEFINYLISYLTHCFLGRHPRFLNQWEIVILLLGLNLRCHILFGIYVEIMFLIWFLLGMRKLHLLLLVT